MDLELIGRLLLALVLGGAIGLEREFRHKAAGFRTILLICVGSALFTLVSLYFAERYGGGAVVDPSRVAAQIVTGIGFLGAGTILQARGAVRGLTTAATIWAVAGVGMAVGSGYYPAAVLATFLIIVALTLFAQFEQWLGQRARTGHYEVVARSTGDLLAALNRVRQELTVELDQVALRRAGETFTAEFVFEASAALHDRLTRLLLETPEILEVRH